jgi:RNA polymerase sigma-70 factor (ECF subfamily)
MDEAELLRRCRAGDRAAQHALYEHHVGRIYRLALRLSGNEQDAFDLTQDAFVRMLQRLDSFDGRCKLGTWLYRVAVNEWLQRLRRRRAEQSHLTVLAAELAAAREDTADRHALDVDAALAGISDEHRVILLLRYHENLSYDEIAETLDVPPGTVASRLSRARTELRTALARRQTAEGEETATRAHPTVQGEGAGARPVGQGP